MTLMEAVGKVGWYLKEVSGETAYDRWVEHRLAHHSGAPIPSRREFERKRMDDRDAKPQQRCC
jgi:uncharacterized short protein YbdD (DUF466 family)